MSGNKIKNQEAHPSPIIATAKQTEEQIGQRQLQLFKIAKNGSMGELASVLAHELTQPLTAINNFVWSCIQRLQSDQFNKKDLIHIMQQTIEQVSRAGEIIHHMKNFIRKDKSSFQLMDINETVNMAISLFNKEISPRTVTIATQLSLGSIFIVGDKIQLELVLINLLRNSFEAMENHLESTQQKLFVSTKKISETLIIVSVSDNGPGFSEANSDQLFTPCFTTKSNGLGVGLAICRTIIETHGGQISAKI